MMQLHGLSTRLNTAVSMALLLLCPTKTSAANVLHFGSPPTTESLSGAESHEYTLDVPAGYFFRVLVDKRGIDVVVSLITPNKDVVATSHGLWGPKGHECVGATAPAPGTYIVMIEAWHKTAAQGKYAILLEVFRRAAPRDRAWVDGLVAYTRARTAIDASALTSATACKAVLHDLETSLVKFEIAGDLREVMARHQQLAYVYAGRTCGGPDSSFFHSFRAVHFARLIRDRDSEAGARLEIGGLYFSAGYLAAATAQANAALSLSNAADNSWDAAGAYELLGFIENELNDYGRALRFLELSRSACRASNRDDTHVRLAIAGLYRRTSKPGAALAEYADAYKEIMRRGRDDRTPLEARVTRAELSGVLSGMAFAAAESKDFRRARKCLREESGLIDDTVQRNYVRFITAYLDIMEGSALSLAPSESALEAYIATIERDNSEHEFLIERFAENNALSQWYALLIDLFMHDHSGNNFGMVKPAADIAERARSHIVLQASTRWQNGDADDKDLYARQRRIREQLSERAGIGADASDESGVGRSFQDLLDEYDEVNLALAARATSDVRKQRRVVTTEEVQNDLLDSGTVVLSYSFMPDHGYCWVITKRKLRAFSVPGANKIMELVRALPGEDTQKPGDPADRDQDWSRVLKEISRVLVKPADPDIRGKRVIVIPQGPAHFIPFAALPVKGRDGREIPLIANGPVLISPSYAAATPHSHLDSTPASKLRVAVLADPVFSRSDPRLQTGTNDGRSVVGVLTSDVVRATRAGLDAHLSPTGLPRLPFTRAEAESIRQVLGDHNVRVSAGFDATIDTLLSLSPKETNVIHIASHGFLNSTRPELSGVVLSLYDARGHSVPGFLRVADILSTRMPVDLVVLSACRTALGFQFKSGDVLGLTDAFVYAGARHVVSTLWKVDDAATAVFMRRFYEALNSDPQRSVQNAIRAAQLSLRDSESWKSPYFWAPFTVTGDWE